MPFDIYLIRHAKAGKRLEGPRGRFRPLDPDGHRQAGRLATFFQDVPVDRIISSPAVRCRQTLEPIADDKQLPVQEDQALWEDSLPSDVLGFMNSTSKGTTILSSHGNLIPAVIWLLRESTTTVEGRGGSKGSIWHIRGEPNNWETATYYAPTDVAEN